MKKILVSLLTVAATVAMLTVSTSALTLDAIKESETECKQLTWQNYNEYDLNGEDIPEAPSLLDGEWTIGSYEFPKNDCAFLNMDGPDTAGWTSWDISDKNYEKFYCQFGKGTWNHSSGTPCKLTVYADDVKITETDYIATMGDPAEINIDLPANTKILKLECMSEDGSFASCSCIVAEATVFMNSDKINYDAKLDDDLETVPEQTEYVPATKPLEETTAPAGTEAPKGTTASDTKPADTSKDGCGSVIGAGALVLVALAAAPVALLRKKH